MTVTTHIRPVQPPLLAHCYLSHYLELDHTLLLILGRTLDARHMSRLIDTYLHGEQVLCRQSLAIGCHEAPGRLYMFLEPGDIVVPIASLWRIDSVEVQLETDGRLTTIVKRPLQWHSITRNPACQIVLKLW